MKTHTHLLIVGAGIVGCSTAYYLAQMGWKDVLVVDKGELFENDGSTSHAPGGVVPLGTTEVMTKLGFGSVELFSSLQPWKPDRNHFNPVGGLELARRPERMDMLKQLHGAAQAFGVEAELITSKQIEERVPYIKGDTYLGALFVKKKMIAAGAHLSGALARDAEAAGGVRFMGHTKVTEFIIQNGRLTGVKTDNPDLAEITCEQLLLCTNIWTPALTETFGITIPLLASEHQYVISTPVEALAHLDVNNKDHEVIYPTVRDLDMAMYWRHHWNKIGVGSYHHKPRMVDPRAVSKTAMHPFTPEDFDEAWQIAQNAIPTLRGAGLTKAFNGMFSFSVDGFPITGPTPVKGFWVATAIWLTHAGGVGKAMANWLTHGDPGLDARQINVNRFMDYQLSQKFIQVACTKNYAEVYDIIHPAQPPSKPRNVRLTPFYEREKALGAYFTSIAGFEIPYWYEGNAHLLHKYSAQIPDRTGWGAAYWSRIQGAEHLATRETVGLFDVTTLGIIEVSGPSAAVFLDQVCTQPMDVPPGTVVYTLMCTPRGGIKRDLTVVRLEKDRFWMFAGRMTVPQELDWLRQHAPAEGVMIRERSSEFASLGLWGPRAREVLASVSPNDVSHAAFPYFTAQWIEVGMAKVLAIRVSYAGELGWELYTSLDFGAHLWDTLWEAGQASGMVACGAGAFRSLRVEKGYRLWGSDVHTDYDPYEAGMGWMVKLNKGDFIGREALLAKKGHNTRRLVTLTLDDPNAALMGYEPVFHEGKRVGMVTSGNYGYCVGKYVAFAYVPVELAAPGTALEVAFVGVRYPATVAVDVLFDPKNERMKS
ncbi:MAG: FAD-dependent oxidoreductase [Anaerolineales bacterium]